MLVRQMRGNPYGEVAISPQSGEAGVLCGGCKMVVANNVRKSAKCLRAIHLITAIYEEPVVF
jgi:hypothetical protein